MTKRPKRWKTRSWRRRAEPVPVAVLREEAGTAIAARLGALQKMAADARTAMAALNRSAASAGERSSPMAAMKATKAKKTAISMKAMKTKKIAAMKAAEAKKTSICKKMAMKVAKAQAAKEDEDEDTFFNFKYGRGL